jgi:uncharacterized repeat protein (TIGR01451 family)
MKRVFVRVALLAAIGGGGYVGVSQAYKAFGPQPAPPGAAAVDPTAAQPDLTSLKPIPLTADDNGEPAAAPAPAMPDRYANMPASPVGDRYADVAEPESSAGRDPFADARAARAIRDARRQAAALAREEAREEVAARPDPFAAASYGAGAQDAGPTAGAQQAAYTPDASDATAGPATTSPTTPNSAAAGVVAAAAVAPVSDEPRQLAPVEDSRPLPVAAGGAPVDERGARPGRGPILDAMTRPASADGLGGANENLFAAGSRGGNQDATPVNVAPEQPQPADGIGRPGAQQLEGSQSPSLAIEKTAPAEIQVGKPVTFTIKVRNTGSVVAHGVEIHDEIPQGTQLVSTKPPAAQPVAGQIVWSLGTMKPGEDATVQIQLLPVAEGEIGSLATVHFRAEASVRTRATRPALALQVTLPQKVMIGADLTMRIRVSNPGSGVATGIVLTENVPAELKHVAGSELELEVGTLKPGEGRDLELTLNAAQAGRVVNLLAARGDANLRAEDRSELEVLAPGLKLALTAPKRRYLERKATFAIAVSNPGTAAAKDIELVATLPKGMKFVEANNLGAYDRATNSVHWSLEELPAQESGEVSLTALPLEPGELKMQVRGTARQGLSDTVEDNVIVEGLAAIMFELLDVQDPVEVNGQATYEIHLVNQGSKAASNVRIVALLPPEMRPLGANGPVRFSIDGQRVLFEPLNQLAPKADTTYTIKAQALQAGDSRVRVQLMSDEIRTPITKEESTRVFSDE